MVVGETAKLTDLYDYREQGSYWQQYC